MACGGSGSRDDRGWKVAGTYIRVDDFCVARIVVDVDCYAAEGGDFGGEVVEAGVVLAFAFVGFGHWSGAWVGWKAARVGGMSWAGGRWSEERLM